MDSTWSVRIPDEMKEKISGLVSESGLNSKDFLAQIIQVYELKNAKDTQPLLGSDIDELSCITGRINSIFINIGDRITSYLKQKEEESHLKLEEKSQMLELFHKRIKEQDEKILLYQDNINLLEKDNEEIRFKSTQLNEICEANKALLAEYNDKGETLSALHNENKEYKTVVENLKTELSTKKELQQASEVKIHEFESTIATLKNQLQTVESECSETLKKELELLHFNKDKEILHLKTDYQQRMESAHQNYSDKTKELLLLIEDMQKPNKITSNKNKEIKSK